MKAVVHQLSQGTELWNQFRSTHYGASEAAAMLGISPYMRRNELLQLKATGKSKDHSDYTKKIFQDGHDAEAAARLLLEEDMQEDFYPVTCSKDKLSASIDGLTMDGSTAFEHKLLSNGLFESVVSQQVPDHYMAQCQQILMVTGAERVIFMCSDGTREKRASVEVIKDQSWFDRITAGWDQFTRDLETFQPKEFADKTEPEAIMQLPALSIQIRGEVTVSNLPQFKVAADTFIANIKTNLQTDEDFANAEATVKFCDETERKLEAAKQSAIGQTASIDELMRTIDHIKDQIRSKRLTLEKSVKNEKENRKKEIIDNAHTIIRNHVEELRKEFKQCDFVLLAQNFISRQFLESACKNKRTIASLHDSADTEVAAIKIKLNELARIIRKNLTHLPEDLSLFRDLQSIITKPEDDFKLLVESRMADQKRKEEEAKERAIAEATERMKKIKEEESIRIESLPTDIKSVLADEKKQLNILKIKSAEDIQDDHRKKVVKKALDALENLGNASLYEIVEAIADGKVKPIYIDFCGEQ